MSAPAVQHAGELLNEFADEVEQIDRAEFAEEIGDLRKRETGALLHALDRARGQITDLLEAVPDLDQWLPDGDEQHTEAVGALSDAGERLYAMATQLAPGHDRS